MGLREFARLVERDPGFISQIINGKRSPPLESITEWAKILEIPKAERQLFCDLAWVAHLPKQLQARFAEIVTTHGEIERTAELLSRRVAELEAKYGP